MIRNSIGQKNNKEINPKIRVNKRIINSNSKLEHPKLSHQENNYFYNTKINRLVFQESSNNDIQNIYQYPSKIEDRESFEYAKTLVEFIKHNLINNKDLGLILVGNKSDIRETDISEIKITQKEINQHFEPSQYFSYIETSCKNNHNIDKIKKIIEEIEIDEGENDEDIGGLTEEERKRKVKESDESCLIY